MFGAAGVGPGRRPAVAQALQRLAEAEPLGPAHEVAYKGAVTDALKRALRHFGVTWNGVKSIGRAL
ncbi:MAG: Rad52/Rad22 family DNA repair protein [Dehalococcoidia bacterium]